MILVLKLSGIEINLKDKIFILICFSIVQFFLEDLTQN